jgi:hypothetical protein
MEATGGLRVGNLRQGRGIHGIEAFNDELAPLDLSLTEGVWLGAAAL